MPKYMHSPTEYFVVFKKRYIRVTFILLYKTHNNDNFCKFWLLRQMFENFYKYFIMLTFNSSTE